MSEEDQRYIATLLARHGEDYKVHASVCAYLGVCCCLRGAYLRVLPACHVRPTPALAPLSS